jgi:hypothetical protein
MFIDLIINPHPYLAGKQRVWSLPIKGMDKGDKAVHGRLKAHSQGWLLWKEPPASGHRMEECLGIYRRRYPARKRILWLKY